MSFRFNHQHTFRGAGNNQVQFGLSQLVGGRVEHIRTIDITDTCGTDRAHEGKSRDRQRSRGTDQGGDVRIVFQIMADRGADDLRFIAIALVEERADRAIDQTGGQNLFLCRTAFTLEEATGDFARGVCLLLVVNRQREEIDPFLRLLLAHGRAEYG